MSDRPGLASSRAFGLCARQEMALAVRSRFTQVFALVFAALALATASSGYVLSGGHGLQDFARTAASLVELVSLLVPLAALLLGTTALAPDRGAIELLLSQPVDRSVVLFGKLAGLFLALAGAEALGFGAAGVVIFAQSGRDGLPGFLLLAGGGLVLTAVFLAVAAALTGAFGRRRLRALAFAMLAWFVMVVLFDVVALGAASLLPSGAASRLLIVSVLVNPVDAVRTGTLLGLEGTGAFGSASLAFLRFTKGTAGAALLLALSLGLWVVIPAVVASARLRRADL